MSGVKTAAQAHKHAEQHSDDKTTFGFWVYLMTDCVLFASLFATYAVLRHSTFGGPSGGELFSLSFVLIETLILLTSSFTIGLAVLSMQSRKKAQALVWLLATFMLGAVFLGMEIYEFSHLIHEGNSWRRSGFLSAFFTLVGTHGVHIAVGLLWVLTMFMQILNRGFTKPTIRRLTLLSLYWHFLDIVWIFIFTFVYLFGAIK